MPQLNNLVNPLSGNNNSMERIQTQGDLESLTDLFYHSNTKRIKATTILFKIIGGRIEKYGNCITKQVTFGYEMFNFGYGKILTERQIRRVTDQLKEAGLLTYERSTNDRASVYSYSLTELGISAYYHFIKNKHTKLSTKSVDRNSASKKCPVEQQKMSGRESSKTYVVHRSQKKNVRSNISYINNNTSSSFLSVNKFLNQNSNKPKTPVMASRTMINEAPPLKLTPKQRESVTVFCQAHRMSSEDTLVMLDESAMAMSQCFKSGVVVKDFDGFVENVGRHVAEKYYWTCRA